MKIINCAFNMGLLMILLTVLGCRPKIKDEVKKEKEVINLEVLVGTYTENLSKGIYRLTINSETGEVKNKELLVEVENPSFLAVSNNNKNIFAVQENKEGKVFSYKWNDTKTKLVEISNVFTSGMHPCYVSLNEAENLLSVGNYSSGNIAIYKLNSEGKINDQFVTKQHIGKGTFLPRQESAHAHCVKFYNNNLYAVDLGIDQIVNYQIDNKKVGKQNVVLKADDGDGVRHLVFHPSKNISYVTTEFSNSIIVSEIYQKTGVFNRIQKVSMLPENYIKESFAADIHISNDGKFLYASNRGHNSIATFSIDKEGKLTLINHIDTQGVWPRNFALSKDNKFLLVANQFGNNVVVFKRDKESGKLTYTGFQTEMSLPVFVKFL